jgi:hypothetical protein
MPNKMSAKRSNQQPRSERSFICRPCRREFIRGSESRDPSNTDSGKKALKSFPKTFS